MTHWEQHWSQADPFTQEDIVAKGLTRLAGIAVGAALLVSGCTADEGQTGEPVTTSPTAALPSVAVPVTSPAVTSPAVTTRPSSPPSSIPVASRTQITRPTVSGVPDGSASASRPVGLPTATATGTGGDGVPTGTAAFNQPFEFPSGLRVNITTPTVFTPSADVSVLAGMTYVFVTVTLQNASPGPIDIGIVGHDATAGGQEAIRIYDPANNIVTPDQNPGQLAPGRARSYRVGFAQRPGLALQVRTAHGWDGQVIHG